MFNKIPRLLSTSLIVLGMIGLVAMAQAEVVRSGTKVQSESSILRSIKRGIKDIFRLPAQPEFIAHGPAGFSPAVTDNGRFVAFASYNDYPVEQDLSGESPAHMSNYPRLYLRDRTANKTYLLAYTTVDWRVGLTVGSLGNNAYAFAFEKEHATAVTNAQNQTLISRSRNLAVVYVSNNQGPQVVDIADSHNFYLWPAISSGGGTLVAFVPPDTILIKKLDYSSGTPIATEASIDISGELASNPNFEKTFYRLAIANDKIAIASHWEAQPGTQDPSDPQEADVKIHFYVSERDSQTNTWGSFQHLPTESANILDRKSRMYLSEDGTLLYWDTSKVTPAPEDSGWDNVYTRKIIQLTLSNNADDVVAEDSVYRFTGLSGNDRVLYAACRGSLVVCMSGYGKVKNVTTNNVRTVTPPSPANKERHVIKLKMSPNGIHMAYTTSMMGSPNSVFYERY